LIFHDFISMTLKAILLGFNGTLIDTEPLHRALMTALMADQGLPLRSGEYEGWCLGRSDREALTNLWAGRRQWLHPALLDKLVNLKAQRYRQALTSQDPLPLFPDAADFLFRLRLEQFKLALVTRGQRWEVDWVLEQSQWHPYFAALVTGEDIEQGKPDPEGYGLAIDRLNAAYPHLQLQPQHCLAVEDTHAGFEAAHQAGLAVVGVAHTLPLHLVQRRVEWGVDRLVDLEIDRVKATFALQDLGTMSRAVVPPHQ